MIKLLDSFLDKITMYRLVLYVLIALSASASTFGFLGIIPFSGLSIIASVVFLLVMSWATNLLFAKAFNAPFNIESFYITALILMLIVSPAQDLKDFMFLGWVAILAMASKYILAINRKHIFNPAAFAVALTSVTIFRSASWWVGTSVMLPFVIIGGFMIIRKLRYESLVISFIVVSILTTVLFSLGRGNVLITLKQIFIGSPILFFAFIMLTEPATLPPTKNLKVLYGGIIGFLFAPQTHLGSYFFTPETALLIGNIFSYLVSPKKKLLLNLWQKNIISPDTLEFIFKPVSKFVYTPGQYMEWTLDHDNPDSRGNRRFFTLASSPSEENLRLGIKFQENGSSFKNAFKNLDDKTAVMAGQLAGDFTLPKDLNKKIVFLAGGIGITPFRSILKYMTDTGQRRDIILFYSNKRKEDIVYKDVIDQAEKYMGIKVIYSLTDTETPPEDWSGNLGRIDSNVIVKEVPDYKERLFYLSGPHAMVTSYEITLKDLGVRGGWIKKDYFPGFV